MSDADSTPSLADLIRDHGEQVVRRLFDIHSPHCQAVFLTQLYETLDEVIRHLEDDADIHHSASEEAISRSVVRQLQQAGYVASAETQVRGHVDIKVNSGDRKRCWIGEAKIHRKYEDLVEALLQLISRYATGRDPDGGILILVQNKGCDEVMNRWRRHLMEQGTEQLMKIVEDPTRRCFRSIHSHDSGAEYCIRHMSVHLHYAPRDKSATRSVGQRRLKREG